MLRLTTEKTGNLRSQARSFIYLSAYTITQTAVHGFQCPPIECGTARKPRDIEQCHRKWICPLL